MIIKASDWLEIANIQEPRIGLIGNDSFVKEGGEGVYSISSADTIEEGWGEGCGGMEGLFVGYSREFVGVGTKFIFGHVDWFFIGYLSLPFALKSRVQGSR